MVNTKKDSFRGNTISLQPSRFKTIAIDVVNDLDPQQKILSTIENQDIENCVVKIIYSIKPEQLYSINTSKIKEQLSKTSFCSITSVVVQNPSKTNLSEVDAALYKSPLKALEKYLDHKSDLNKPELLKKAQLLIEELAETGR